MHNTIKISAAFAALTLLAGAAFAQTPPPPPPVHHGIFSKLFHPKPKTGMAPYSHYGTSSSVHPGMMQGHPMMGGGSMMGGHSMMGNHSMMGGGSMMGGQFIGNKNSHVYHMPGDRGSMPSPQNRVYFSSAAAAEAAGYHVAGGGHSMSGRPTMMHH